MPFNLISAWNKRRRTKSHDHIDPWVYKPVEGWQLAEYVPASNRGKCSSVFTYKEMEEATLCFDDENFIGKGGFGRVYKGILKNGEVVAIKKMELPPPKVADGEREFRVEVDMLSRLDHPNIVSLTGYCADGKHRFLVYEFMSNGSLQDRLNGWLLNSASFRFRWWDMTHHTTSNRLKISSSFSLTGIVGIGDVKLDWHERLKIALGAARGLAHLHSSTTIGIPVVHRDFKSSNILLDDNFEAKISDFGLAKLMPNGEGSYETTKALGTFGYFDPEYTSTGKLTLQSDVYAFGVVLLELLTGRRAVELCQGSTDQNLILQIGQVQKDRKRLRRIMDPDMPRGSYTMESVTLFVKLASRCVRIESLGRPTVADCVCTLQLAISANAAAAAGRSSFSVRW